MNSVRKICPIGVKRAGDLQTLCIEEDCAWYVIKSKKCAVRVIGAILFERIQKKEGSK